MMDQIYDRNYQVARADLNRAIETGLSRLGREIANVFVTLNRIEFAAPWNAPRTDAKGS